MSKSKRIRSHLNSWVMLSPTSTPPYTPLPKEQTLLTSSPRVALSISTPSHYPAKQQQPFSLSSSSGVLYLTSHRVIFLPDKSTSQLQSFAAPILSLHDSHVAAPWFGPNVWTALLQPTKGGRIPTPSTGVVEIKLTFKEGGAFDFHTAYERVRERVMQNVEVSRMNGDTADASGSAINGGVAAVNMEDLPVYQERGDGPLMSPIASVPAVASQPEQQRSRNGQRDSETDSEDDASRQKRESVSTPVEPPPGYEETQMESLRDEAERRGSAAGRAG